MKVYLDTVGCRLNQAEIEGMATQLRAAGHEIVAVAAHADLAIVNTCTVTTNAASDSRAILRRLGAHQPARTVATGCWATLQQAAAAAIPGVVMVVPNADKERLVQDVLGEMRVEGAPKGEPRQAIPGTRHRTRACIKVQDGCDNHCTFCVTTIARGRARSRRLMEVLDDVRMALAGGANEIVLTGVHLGSWGSELGLHLRELVRTILMDTDVRRLRLSSLEPWDLDAGFFRLWRDARLCRHLHLPLQSGCEITLRHMARRTKPSSFRALVEAARSEIADVSITTDVIAGFPGETEAEFRSSVEFVSEMRFAGGHAFTFSPVAGTAASRMANQVPLVVRHQRTHAYLDILEQSARAFRASQLGSSCMVLWERASAVAEGAWVMGGLTDNNVRVQAPAPASRWNRIDAVLLTELLEEKVNGIIVESGMSVTYGAWGVPV